MTNWQGTLYSGDGPLVSGSRIDICPQMYVPDETDNMVSGDKLMLEAPNGGRKEAEIVSARSERIEIEVDGSVYGLLRLDNSELIVSSEIPHSAWRVE